MRSSGTTYDIDRNIQDVEYEARLHGAGPRAGSGLACDCAARAARWLAKGDSDAGHIAVERWAAARDVDAILPGTAASTWQASSCHTHGISLRCYEFKASIEMSATPARPAGEQCTIEYHAVVMSTRVTGFYAVLDADDEALARALVQPVQAGGAGASVLQIRIKPDEPVACAEIVKAARMARRVCSEFGALLIVNDRLDIALAVEADGVHLGQDDLPLADARAVLERIGRQQPFLIGISTHNREQIVAAVEHRADYLGFGPMYPTATKKNPGSAQGADRLRAAVAAAGDVPVVAVGGITPDNVAEVAAAGAAAACCISAINHGADPAAAGVAIGAPWLSR